MSQNLNVTKGKQKNTNRIQLVIFRSILLFFTATPIWVTKKKQCKTMGKSIKKHSSKMDKTNRNEEEKKKKTKQKQ